MTTEATNPTPAAAVGRRLIWIPFVLYVVTAIVYFVLLIRGVKANELGSFPDLFEVAGSCVVFFYAAYFACWKWRKRRALRIMISVFCVFAVFVTLGAFEMIGFEGPTIPRAHGMTVSLIFYWFWPGMELELWVENAAAPLAPQPKLQESEIAIQGGMPQRDGSLILFGRATDFSTYGLVGRLDPDGNLDSAFQPVTLVRFVTDMRAQPDGTALIEYADSEGSLIDEVSAKGSRRPIAHVFFTGELGHEQMNVGMKSKVFPARLVTNYEKVTAIHPNGQLDTEFNAEAAKTIREHDLGGVRRVAVDNEGRVIVVFHQFLIRLDEKAHLAPPGAVKFDPVRKQFDPSGIAVDPKDGSIYISSGSERAGEEALPWLIRFDSGLRADEAFSTAASNLAGGAGCFHVLGFRPDGGIVVSIVREGEGSRILILNRSGQLVRELTLKGR